jgi:hypothetical protein
MMLDRFFALVSLAALTAFCVLLISYVGRLDLAIVIAICLLMAAYDLFIFSFKGNGPGKTDDPGQR